MAIQELIIQGYRSLREVKWCPGQLNLLVGPNGSGKSNLLSSIALIAASARGHLLSALTQSGGLYRVLWNHQAGSCGWAVRIGDREHPPRLPRIGSLEHELHLSQIGSGSGYEISNERLKQYGNDSANGDHTLIFCREPGSAEYYDADNNQVIDLADETSGTGTGSVIDFSESLLSQLSDVRNPLPTIAKQTLEGWQIFSEIAVGRGSGLRQPSTTQFAKRINSDGSNLVTVLHTHYTGNRDFKAAIDGGMSAAFGDEFESLEFQPAASQQIQLAIQWKSSSQPHIGSDLSDGTLRFLVLLTLLCNPNSPEVIAIDEPETGLHPSMLSIIAEYASAASSDTQIIFTTHSPEFLDAFTELDPAVTLCHWEDGETSLHQLDSDRLSAWLGRYRLGELFTRGELEILALPDVEADDDLQKRLEAIPSEDEALAAAETS